MYLEENHDMTSVWFEESTNIALVFALHCQPTKIELLICEDYIGTYC